MQTRWTVRGVESEVIALVQEISATSGESLGALVTEAIRFWHASLPEADEHPDLAELRQLLSEQRMLIEQLYQRLS